jgi:hypothetical protein
LIGASSGAILGKIAFFGVNLSGQVANQGSVFDQIDFKVIGYA